MTASVRAASGLSAWRAAVIGLVAVLSAGMGVALGGFLLEARSGALSGAAAYVPADAPFFVELRLQPSAAQDASLRELLGRFPTIEGVDLDRPLYDQLVDLIDEKTASEIGGLRWAQDIAPWFGGTVAFGMTAFPVEAMGAMDPMAEPPIPEMLLVISVTDAEAARTTVERVVSEMALLETTSSEHRGATVYALGSGEGAYAVTDDALLVAPTAENITAALDTAADSSSRLSDAESVAAMAAQLPSDWLAFASYDFTELMAASFAQAEGDATAEVFRSLMEDQPLRGAMVMAASGDRFTTDSVSEAPSGNFAVENTDRGLADEVPADALYFADGGNIGASMAAFVRSMVAAAEADPTVAEQIETAEAALGADLEEMVSWIDDGAIVAGWDGSEPYAGLLLVPNDVDAAERRIGQLVTFAGLATMDPSSGITVDESDVAGETVTTIRWEDPNAMPMEGMPIPTGLAVQVTVTGDRAVLGLGERFVGRVLELDASDSLGADPRFTDAVAELGPDSNAGVAWMDLAGTREAIEAALEPMFEFIDPEGLYETEIRPWLLPLDRAVSVSVLQGDFLVQHAALLIE
ncbi:MAG: DUF3352 domain-containing protein [Chloroflexota bacterium]|nr:DUF3352 domain-containing protein [Chloroflexota bacterium]